MSYVQIGSERRSLSDATQQWIAEQVHRRSQAGQGTCVQVSIQESNVNVAFQVGDCGGSSIGSPRVLSAEEQKVVDLWNQRGLDSGRLDLGRLIAFLQQIKSAF